MAATKISALTASSALAGSEVFPSALSGANYGVTSTQIKTWCNLNPAITGSLSTSGNISAGAWTTSGVRVKVAAATYTDTSSSGTVAAGYTDVLGAGTIAASSAVTFTDYYSRYIKDPVAGTNVTITNKWSLGLEGGLKVGGTISSPGSGASSEHFGVSSAATGAQGTAFGAFATANFANSASFGYGAVVTGTVAASFGRSASAGASSVAVGYAATVAGTSSVGVGNSASAPAGSAVAVGQNASVAVTETGGIAIGKDAAITAGSTGGGENIALGTSSIAAEWRATALGWKAKATAISSTAVGRGAYSAYTHAIAFGRGAWTNAANQIAIGFSGGDVATDVYFESGHTSKYVDYPEGNTVTRTPSLTPIIIHGFDGYDATGTPTNNIAGGPLCLAGGRSTGTAAGGSVKLQVSPAGGVSNNTKNALVDSLVIDSTHLAAFTGPVKTLSTVVGSLPSASTSGAGARAFVTDANATTFLSTVAGGGSNKVPVVSDGTNWLIG